MTPALALFTLTLFVSATLLFLVQPLIGKLILPLFGGTPAVWATCMVFFQAALLAGYSYAHYLATRLDVRKQAAVHLAVILLPLAAFFLMPLGVAEGIVPSTQLGPALGAVWILFQLVGVPFFVVSTSAPLLQRWFGNTDDPSAKDPYFLYAASNAGSMLALLCFPFVLEPNLRLRTLGMAWMVGYGVLAVLTVACAGLVIRGPRRPARSPLSAGEPVQTPKAADDAITANPPADLATEITTERLEPPVEPAAEPPTLATRLRWVLLAFVPSSLMLGVTTYMTTDIAAVPLLWIIPLTLYLLTFILVFSRSMAWLHDFMVLLFPVMVLLIVFQMISGVQQPGTTGVILRFLIHLAGLFVVAMVCHGELAKTRPATPFLTVYYLCLSLGGVLGGAFNGLAAPLLFSTVAEYPLALTLACVFLTPLPQAEGEPRGRLVEFVLALVIGCAALYFVILLARQWHNLPALVPYGWKSRPLAWGLLALLAALLLRFVYRAANPTERRERWLDLGLPLGLGIAAFGLTVLNPFEDFRFAQIMNWLNVPPDSQKEFRHSIMQVLTYVPVVGLCYGLASRPARFALGVGAILAASSLSINTANILCQERSFFGVHRVEVQTELTFGQYHALLHGTTLHGLQRAPGDPQLVDATRSGSLAILAAADPWQAAVAGVVVGETLRDIRNEPLAYFHASGPIGQIFQVMQERPTPPQRIAILGLGSGMLAGYLRPGQHAVIYEIDPLAVQIAENPRYFTFLRDTRGSYEIVLGDGRLKLAEAPDCSYDMLFMDAFSSDSIPVHLVTREALQLYFRKLKPDGILIINIANRYLRLAPVLANIALELDLVGLVQSDGRGTDPNRVGYIPGKYSSSWAVLARRGEDFGLGQDIQINTLLGLFRPNFLLPRLHPMNYWQVLEPEPNKGVWTDDYSNLVRILGP